MLQKHLVTLALAVTTVAGVACGGAQPAPANPAGGATTGGGVAPLQVDEVMGVMKAYATRVGSGPFVTELTDAIGERIAVTGHEVGTTTGRRRRVGWNDAVPLRYAVELNGVSSIMLNKIDVLSGIPEILLCVAYEIDGRRVTHVPSHIDDLKRAVPVYETLPGWRAELDGIPNATKIKTVQ